MCNEQKDNDVIVLNDQGGVVMSIDNVSATLRAESHGHPPVVAYEPSDTESGEEKMGGVISAGLCPESSSKTRSIGYEEETSPTIRAGAIPAVVIAFEPGIAKREGKASRFVANKCPTLRAKMGDNQPAICYAQSGFAEYREGIPCLRASGGGGDGSVELIVKRLESNNGENALKRKYILRKLTPLECCRLQGFPDWWCDGVDGSDSNQYKMWGNGIALPCAADVIGRIARALEDESNDQTR